jgi:hypothetical protein
MNDFEIPPLNPIPLRVYWERLQELEKNANSDEARFQPCPTGGDTKE